MTKEALEMALELLAVGTFHSPELQAKRTEVIEQGLKALAQPEPTNLERHERNVQRLFGTPQPKEPEQEPVAMKFKIYKPTAPDPVRQGINNALLPWVYDQDRSSGFDASMWVTPVATLPPQRKPLTDKERTLLAVEKLSPLIRAGAVSPIDAFNIGITATEAAHGIKE